MAIILTSMLMIAVLGFISQGYAGKLGRWVEGKVSEP